MNNVLRSLGRALVRAVETALRQKSSSTRTAGGTEPRPVPPSPSPAARPSQAAQAPAGTRSSAGRRNGGEPSPYGAASAHEFDPGRELPQFDYEPHDDGDADPGEVIWTWVPFEDDPVVGKDRPALVLAQIGDDVVIAQLTSKDRDKDRADEARWGRYWMDIGTGEWDRRGRDSEVRIDRLLRVGQRAVRREGGVLDHGVFLDVVEAVKDAHRRGL